MAIDLPKKDRAIGHDGIQHRRSGTTTAVQSRSYPPTVDLFLVRVVVSVFLELAEQLVHALGLQVDPLRQDSRKRGVEVPFDESGQHQLAAEVDRLGAFAGEIRGARVVADVDDLVTAYGDGFGPGVGLVYRVDLAVREDEIRWLCSRGRRWTFATAARDKHRNANGQSFHCHSSTNICYINMATAFN